MTVEDVRAEVAAIRRMAGDAEMAHGAEDELHQNVLRAIAAGADNAAEIAGEALMTMEIEFERWCA